MHNLCNLTVVIPYHGRISFFRETLESLKQQTTKDFCVIISDDSDELRDQKDLAVAVKEYKRFLSIKVVRTKANLGPIANTKQAIDAASTDFIRILHTDDIIAPNTIRLEFEIIKKFPNLLMIFHNASPFKNKFVPNEHGRYSENTWINSWLLDKSLNRTILPSCIVFHKRILYEVGFFNPNFKFMYDWEWQIKVFEYAYIHHQTLVEILPGYVGWRMSNDQESSTKCLLCWKDSRKIIPIIKASYNRLNVIKKRDLNKLLRNLKREYNNRCLCEYYTYKNFRLPLRLRIKIFLKKIKKLIYNVKNTSKGTKEYTKITVLGIKIKIKEGKTSRESKKIVKWLIANKVVPLIYKNNFYYYNCFPMLSENYYRVSNEYKHPKVGIVLQGPLFDGNFVAETIKIYKSNFKFSNVEFIVSTWSDEKEKQIQILKEKGIHIVLSDKISNAGGGNLNFQIISTLAGLKKARELNCEYVVKTRTDQRFYETNILETCFNLQNIFPVNSDKLHSRLIALSFNTFKYRWYGISDMFLFGHIDDVEKYWNIPFSDQSDETWATKNQFEQFQQLCPETYIVRHFLKNINYNVKDTLQDSYKVIADLFVIIDKEMIEMYWPKYSNMSCRWEFFCPHAMEELRFKDWINLYMRKGKMQEWENPLWTSLPNYSSSRK